MNSAIFVIPSHNNHGSEAFPPMPPPSIISENICPTRAVKQSFSKSSVGRRTANTPWTNNCLYAASFSACCCTAYGSPPSGTGDNAGKGQSEWYICRGSDWKGAGCKEWWDARYAAEFHQHLRPASVAMTSTYLAHAHLTSPVIHQTADSPNPPSSAFVPDLAYNVQ